MRVKEKKEMIIKNELVPELFMYLKSLKYKVNINKEGHIEMDEEDRLDAIQEILDIKPTRYLKYVYYPMKELDYL